MFIALERIFSKRVVSCHEPSRRNYVTITDLVCKSHVMRVLPVPVRTLPPTHRRRTPAGSLWHFSDHLVSWIFLPAALSSITFAGLWLYLYRNLVFHRRIKRKFVLIQRGAGMAAAILAKNLYEHV
jgi:hypothetical protein